MSRLTSMAAIAALSLSAVAAADSGHGQHSAAAGEKSGGHAESGGDSTLADAWAALVAAKDAITREVESGKLADVHALAEPLPQLGQALLQQSSNLGAAKRVRVEGAINQIGRVAGALHDAADANDGARTRKELERLGGLYQLIETQYPKGALSGGRRPQEAHDAHGAGGHRHGEVPKGVVDREPRATLRVRAFDPFRFEPSRLEVDAGVPTRIELENSGVIEHSLVVKTPDGSSDWVHLHVLAGATDAATYEFDRPGTYEILCTIPGHTEGGMIGKLVVRDTRKTTGHEGH